MKKKIIPIIFIVIGIIIILYPKANEYYNEYKQKKILEDWENIIVDLDSTDEIVEDEEVGELKNIDRVTGGMEGLLKIDKIDLKLPILTGASQENMKTSVASIDHTGFPGQVGNYAISGHRNLTYGRNFNRLDEVIEGDSLLVETDEEEYEYKVVEKLYVLPEDTWVLKGNDKDKEITLITCHPVGLATHRLIIKGRLIEKDI